MHASGGKQWAILIFVPIICLFLFICPCSDKLELRVKNKDNHCMVESGYKRLESVEKKQKLENYNRDEREKVNHNNKE